MVFVEMSLKLLQRYLIAMAGARFSKESPSYLVGRDGSMPVRGCRLSHAGMPM